MARLTTLKPRVQVLGPRLAPQPKPSQAPTYRIRGRALQQIRAEHFRAHPLCVMCLEQGKVSIATDLDHIQALTNGGKDVEYNRQGLCHPCHEIKTLADLGIKSDAFTYKGPLWRLAERAPQIRQQQADFAELRFPSDIQSSRIPCVMVCGPPNGGKHPYVREHAGHNDVVIDLDQITPELSGLPVWQVGIEWLPKALAERNRRLRALASDYTHVRAWFLINAPDPTERALWAERLGAEVVLLAPPVEECIRRIKAEPYHEGYTERMLDAAQQWWAMNSNVQTHIAK
ncbi:MAG: HNH endonuclease [Gallionella sp.]|nr:HNH endonuclease [Gallionella sp.]